MIKERRIERRIPLRIEVGCIKNEDYLISYSRDISVDGIFLCMEQPFSTGTKIKLLFSFEEGENEMEIDALVMWVNDSGSSKDFGIGVKFLDPPDRFKTLVLAEVNRVAVLNE